MDVVGVVDGVDGGVVDVVVDVVVVVFGAVLRVVGVVVAGVVRLVEVVGFVVVGLVVVLGLLGPNDPPPAVDPVPSCWARAEATEMQTIAIIEINRNDKGRWFDITFLLIGKTADESTEESLKRIIVRNVAIGTECLSADLGRRFSQIYTDQTKR